MYTVSLLDSTLKEEFSIYDPFTSDEEFMLTEPKLSISASQAGTFSCEIPITNRGYDKIVNHRTRAVVRKDNKIVFMGRITSCYKDLYLNQKIEAEGALAYLNDSLTGKEILQNKTLSELLIYIFTNHNSKFPDEKWKQFNLTVCEGYFTGRDNTNPNSNLLSLYSVNYYSSMECVTELLTLANAVLKISYNDTTEVWDVYVYPRYNCPVCSQPIEFGTNLVDLVQSYQNNICSVVAPFGGELIQTSKEIGEIIAGDGVENSWAHWYNGACYMRDKDNPTGGYNPYNMPLGYWVFELNINEYNSHQTDAYKLKQLYVSWRGYYFEQTIDNVVKCEDCAWRVYDESNNTIGFKKFDSTVLVSGINELIDLTTPQYLGAAKVVVSGWGGVVNPSIRRNAVIIEENDRLTITKCDAFDTDSDGLRHPANSPYLYSDTYLSAYGLIEKKLEYDIEDSNTPCSFTTGPTTYVVDHRGVTLGTATRTYTNHKGETIGTSTFFDGYSLGYNCYSDADPDLNTNKGNYEIKPLSMAGGGYGCVEYVLPDPGSSNYPRGVFISCRMHDRGVESYVDSGGNTWYYKTDGMYGLFDVNGYLIAYKAAEPDMFTSIKNEYLDLSDAKYYGTKTIRVGGWGGSIPVNVVPSDDAYARDKLMTQARFYLTQQQWEKVVIEATAVDLNMVDSDWENFDICENAEVYSNPHSITATLPISSIEIQLDNYENNTIKLGYDSDEYLSNQLADNLRILSVEQLLEEKRKEKS